MTKLLQQCFLFFIVVVIPGHNLGNSQVSVNRTIGPTLVQFCQYIFLSLDMSQKPLTVENNTKMYVQGKHEDSINEAASTFEGLLSV